LQLLLSLALLAFGNPASATQRALLVGVSELVNQPQALWLQAPRNDVMLMRDALLKQGFAPSDITVLADGVGGAVLPESQAIHDALGRLLAQSRSGDFVLLYFSGHGTRLRDSSKLYQEPDGLSENFLARDVRGTLGSDSALTGDLRDADFDAWIQALLARNVFVASIFDTCSAHSSRRPRASATRPPMGRPTTRCAGAACASDSCSGRPLRRRALPWRGLSQPSRCRARAMSRSSPPRATRSRPSCGCRARAAMRARRAS